MKEQRVSGFVFSLLCGLSMFAASILKKVPMAVLFGIFLYLGVCSISGVQLFDRYVLILSHKYFMMHRFKKINNFVECSYSSCHPNIILYCHTQRKYKRTECTSLPQSKCLQFCFYGSFTNHQLHSLSHSFL